MSRYIDADALIEEIGRCSCETWSKGVNRTWWVQAVKIKDNIKQCIDRQPTADVVEVRHGHWIEDKETGSLICSECGHFTDEIIGDYITADEEISDTLSIPKGTVIHRSMNPIYCSKCGAMMYEQRRR